VIQLLNKADILNKQFTSVFTKESKKNMSDLGQSSHPAMTDITAQVSGVVKLSRNINHYKAPGQDKNSAPFMKETAAELASALSLIFQASL